MCREVKAARDDDERHVAVFNHHPFALRCGFLVAILVLHHAVYAVLIVSKSPLSCALSVTDVTSSHRHRKMKEMKFSYRITAISCHLLCLSHQQAKPLLLTLGENRVFVTRNATAADRHLKKRNAPTTARATPRGAVRHRGTRLRSR